MLAQKEVLQPRMTTVTRADILHEVQRLRRIATKDPQKVIRQAARKKLSWVRSAFELIR